MDEKVEIFMGELTRAFESGELLKVRISKPTAIADGLEKIIVRPVFLQGVNKLSFVFSYPTKEVTKNYTLAESNDQFLAFLGARFSNAVLFTTRKDVRLSFNRKKKANVRYSRATSQQARSLKHNKEKERMVPIEGSRYLAELGVATEGGEVAPGMRGKYRQINRYIETIDALLTTSGIAEQQKLSVVDMGSGKGYLTFALYDFLVNKKGRTADATGVELREELVALCEGIAQKCGFENLHFRAGDIQSYPSEKMDMLIALHACDTATDDALYKGILGGAEIIVSAPCCHSQVRGELHTTGELASITEYGILEERLAELVTDTMRGLMLKSYGYTTKIFEFISDEHTHKNVMITGVKHNRGRDVGALQELQALKKMFGIENFYLENLLKGD